MSNLEETKESCSPPSFENRAIELLEAIESGMFTLAELLREIHGALCVMGGIIR